MIDPDKHKHSQKSIEKINKSKLCGIKLKCSDLFEALIRTKIRIGTENRLFILPTFNAICATFIIDALALQIGFLFSFSFLKQSFFKFNLRKILKQKPKTKTKQKERDFTRIY